MKVKPGKGSVRVVDHLLIVQNYEEQESQIFDF